MTDSDKCYCDIPLGFRNWLLSIEKLNVKGCQVVNNGILEGCERPAIWFRQDDSEESECIDIQIPYRPGRAFLDLEIHGVSLKNTKDLAGNISAAINQFNVGPKDFDFDGCQADCITATNQDESYRIKAPGTQVGDYMIALSIEIKLR